MRDILSEIKWLLPAGLALFVAAFYIGWKQPEPKGCLPSPGIKTKNCYPGPCSSAAPAWTTYAPIRQVGNLGPVVTDIESHLPEGHPYQDADRITWCHEGTHGINNLLRQKYGRPAFYVLNNRAILIDEPLTTLAYSTVATKVPPSLRGEVYDLYLRQMRRWWEKQPTYVFDEWVAYTNGAEARWQLGIMGRQETVRYAVEFIVYAACVPWVSASHDPQMRLFYMWQVERVVKLSGRSAYLDKLRTEKDASQLRAFLRNYCGPHWTKETLGI